MPVHPHVTRFYHNLTPSQPSLANTIKNAIVHQNLNQNMKNIFLLLLTPFILVGCAKLMGDFNQDISSYEKNNQIGTEEIVIASQELCEIVQPEEVGEIIDQNINLAQPIKDVPISCYYQNTDNQVGVATIVHISQENRSVVEEYDESEEFFENIETIDDFVDKARIVDLSEQSSTMDFLRGDVWINITIRSGSPDQRIEQGKSIASLIFKRL